MYIAYFGRAPDRPGFEYWMNDADRLASEGKTGYELLAKISEDFRLSKEAREDYPFLGMSAGEQDADAIRGFLEDVYDNMFNRMPDDAGAAYWTGQIQDKIANCEAVGGILLDIVSGVQGTDVQTLKNKMAASVGYQSTDVFSDRSGFDGARADEVPDSVGYDTTEDVAFEMGAELNEDNNDPLIYSAIPDAVSMDASGAAQIDLVGNDTDHLGFGRHAEISITRQPEHGTVTLLGNGEVQYQANGAPTLDTFEYQLEPIMGGLLRGYADKSMRAEVTVGPPRDASGSLAVDDTITINTFGQPELGFLASLRVLDNDNMPKPGEVPSDQLPSIIDVSGLEIANPIFYGYGPITIALTGPYEPITDTFTYTVQMADGSLHTATGTVTLTGENDKPVAADDGPFTVMAGETVTIDILANDPGDPEGDPITVELRGGAWDGAAELTSDGQLIYTAPDTAQIDYVSYRLVASEGNTEPSETVDVRFEVQPDPNAPPSGEPIAEPDTATAAPGATLLVDVMANDYDPDGGALDLSSATFVDGFNRPGDIRIVDQQMEIDLFDDAPTGPHDFRYFIFDDEGDRTMGTGTLTIEDGGVSSVSALGLPADDGTLM
jgi:hypothetical protein